MSKTYIINRYLMKEVLYTLFGVLMVLMLIFVSGQLVGLYADAASGSLPVSAVFKALGLKSIANLVFILPLSFYIAILLAFSRLYKDNEMVVLAACGIGQWSVMRSVLSHALLFSMLVAGLALFLAPWAESQSELIFKQFEGRNDVSMLAAGRFRELSQGEGVVYVEEINQDTLNMRHVFMQHRTKTGNSIVSAESGFREENSKTGDIYLILVNGERHEGPLTNGRFAVTTFARHGVRLEQSRNANITFRQKSVPSWELWQNPHFHNMSELQGRISTALICLILTVMAVPLSKTSPRQGRYARLALALLIFIIYSNLLNVARVWISKQIVPPIIGVWWVHVLALLLGLALYVRWRPLLRRFWFGRNH